MTTKSKKENLARAKRNKNDEFYTQLSDIENELSYYNAHFVDKVVYCNCDDPEWSNFYKFFKLNFNVLKLKKLIATHFEPDGKASYALIVDRERERRIELEGNGDFRSHECIQFLNEADIVCTNPPFSLFREYVAQLIEHNKLFLIIGNKNAITYKEIFSLIKHNKMWLGITFPYDFYLDNDFKVISGKLGGLTRWFTNLSHKKRNEEMILWNSYDPDKMPKYDNYDAININKVGEIPMDYDGVMGVPITFLDKYNPHQFEIIELGITGSCNFTCEKKMEILKDGKPTGKYTINAKGTLYIPYNKEMKKAPAFKDCTTGQLYQSVYARILIRKRNK